MATMQTHIVNAPLGTCQALRRSVMGPNASIPPCADDFRYTPISDVCGSAATSHLSQQHRKPEL
jgi:hypothetical protein